MAARRAMEAERRAAAWRSVARNEREIDIAEAYQADLEAGERVRRAYQARKVMIAAA